MELIILRLWIVGAMLSASPVTSWSAAPSNDNFANRIVLNGADFDFTATVFGATFESSEPNPGGFVSQYPDWGSVWWSWTPPTSGFVAITASQVEPIVPDPYPQYPVFVAYKGSVATSLTVASGRNGDRFEVTPGYLIGSGKSFGGFPVSAGQAYTFQLAGNAATNFTFQFHLKLSDRPVILQEPQDQIVASGGAAALTVICPNINPASVQWQFNSNNIPGGTNFLLVVPNVTLAEDGYYQAIVTSLDVNDAAKTNISRAARLTDLGPDLRPTISIRNTIGTTNEFFLRIAGEQKQSYYVESFGPDGRMHPIELQVQNLFPTTWYWPVPPATDVRIERGTGAELQDFRVPAMYQARRAGDVAQTCIGNLKKIEWTKELLRIYYLRPNSSFVADTDLNTLNGDLPPRCPVGGTYTYGSIGQVATCSVPGHTL